MRIVLFGAPGVGKGTFAEILSKKENLKHINVGNILRNEIKKESNIGKEIQNVVRSGNLVSDSLIINIVHDEMKNILNKKYKGFILDGFPRNMYQSKELIKMTNIDLFVNIYLPRNILIKKLLGRRICNICDKNFNVSNIQQDSFDMPPILPSKDCIQCNGHTNLIKRKDDNEDIINHRLNSYESDYIPIIQFFKNEKYNLIDFPLRRGIRDFDDFYSILVNYIKNEKLK
ncbi:GTP:AMP phosphotransferase, putative [Plasmodium reichenowi]|uniref:GTP:AMP phosphotransferase, putative n=1 Tax=Plasmodium reichenowi TaxID=5854 RepID=A0A151LSG9_PLARE|nr:GTP:AMP phosphotransferase, putative [Plasmodium reichenowi]KYO02121.1 GTP:AMP phosphotransferase, putative [Plasmodium reichenowi]